MSNAVKKSKICRQSSEQKKAKVRPKCQISNPHISPKCGRFPLTKTIFLRVTRAIRCKGQVGVRAPKGGKPTTQFSTPHFFENPSSDFSQKLTQGKRLSEVCKSVLWSRSDEQIFRKTSHSFWGFRVWGQNPTRQPGIRPPVFLAQRRHRHRPARAATGQGHVAGQRGPFGRRHSGQKLYFRFDRAGSSILCNSLAE